MTPFSQSAQSKAGRILGKTSTQAHDYDGVPGPVAGITDVVGNAVLLMLPPTPEAVQLDVEGS